MKVEPEECSIDDALNAPNGVVSWTGVRNYQARNFMRDSMQVGDGVIFYHSSCAVPGIAGFALVHSKPQPDPTQFDPASPYYDPKASPNHPRWLTIDIRAVHKTRLMALAELREHDALKTLQILQKGNRLSITEVTQDEWRTIKTLLADNESI